MRFNICLRLLAIIASIGMLSACAEVSLVSHAAKELNDLGGAGEDNDVNRGRHKVGKPYQVYQVWYYPKVDPEYDETGIASWYGKKFHGRKTANGAVYNMNQLTAAHKTLPMPSEVRVTNLENGRSITVTVNDRGPFVNGRIIDLSRRAAQLLGMQRQGTAKVRVQMAHKATNPDERVMAKPVTPDEEKNNVAAVPSGNVQSSSLAAPNDVAKAPVVKAAELPKPVADAPIEVASASQGQSVTLSPVAPTEIFIQAGAFVKYTNANRLGAQLSVLAPTKVSQVLVNGQDFYRVRVGPLYSVEDADGILAKLLNSGHTEARIVIE